MSGVAYFDQRAKRARRDELIEGLIANASELKSLAVDDAELLELIQMVETFKKKRRPEVVAALADAQRRRLTRGT